MRRTSRSRGLVITSERAFSVSTAIAHGKFSKIICSLGLEVTGSIESGKKRTPSTVVK